MSLQFEILEGLDQASPGPEAGPHSAQPSFYEDFLAENSENAQQLASAPSRASLATPLAQSAPLGAPLSVQPTGWFKDWSNTPEETKEARLDALWDSLPTDLFYDDIDKFQKEILMMEEKEINWRGSFKSEIFEKSL